ncbi:HEAT repeat domain-containing protein [Candidatus Micrarchaeota archaeon]|nr:HEAT repeat domain-containing protein [Candidatus Micrarchaeota archaeon]
MNEQKMEEKEKKERIRRRIGELQDTTFSVRGNAALDLGEIGSRIAVPHLIERLKDEDFYVRSQAIRALGKIGSKKAVPHLIEKLNDKWGSDKFEAAFSLGMMGRHEALPYLIERLKDEYYYSRDQAAEALGKIRIKLLEGKVKFIPNQPIPFAFMHINPVEYPKSFEKFLREVRKKSKKSPDYWNLTAKQLIVMEDRLK